MGIVEMAPICHGGRCDEGEGHTVIGTEAAHMSMEKGRTGKELEEECGNEHQEGKNDRDEGSTRLCGSRVVKLMSDSLNAVLDVSPCNEEAKGIAGEECDILQEVAP
jgi:hypothetical protein